MSRGMACLCILGVVALTGILSAQANTDQRAVTGTVAYKSPADLPLDAAIAIRLQDVSLQDARAKVLSEIVISAAGSSMPVRFELPYDTASINPSHNYQVQATLTANGVLLLASTAAYRVLTHGAPSRVAITLQEAGTGAGTEQAGIPLEGTSWKLVALSGKPVLVNGSGAEPKIVLHKGQNSITGSTGCKEVMGTYTVAQRALKFTLIDTTAMVCAPEVIQQEKTLINAMKATRAYRIVGNRLELLLGDEVLAAFQAQKKR